ncbi:MAG: hypothetical protein K1V95_08495 [Eubacterium sp.]
MSDRIKIIIVKCLIAISAFFGVLFLVIPFLAAIFCEQSEYDNLSPNMPMPEPFTSLWIADFMLCAFFTILFVVLTRVMKIENKPIKPDKFPLLFNNFNDLQGYLFKKISLKLYEQQPEVLFGENGKTTVFIKSGGLWKIDCIALICVKEITNEILENANDSITKSLYHYYGKEKITDTVSMISIICVDRITPAFNKLLNSNVEQGVKNFRLPIGISFGGKQIYIPKQKDGFAIAQYRKLRKEFMQIMNLTKEQCIKVPSTDNKK